MDIRDYTADMGYCDISKYTLDSFVFFNSNLSIKFVDSNNKLEGFDIRLQNIVAYNSNIGNGMFSIVRIDSEGSSYGLDVSIRLKQPVLKKFMVLYIFEEVHKLYLFRGLAERVSIFYFDEFNKSSWPLLV